MKCAFEVFVILNLLHFQTLALRMCAVSCIFTIGVKVLICLLYVHLVFTYTVWKLRVPSPNRCAPKERYGFTSTKQCNSLKMDNYFPRLNMDSESHSAHHTAPTSDSFWPLRAAEVERGRVRGSAARLLRGVVRMGAATAIVSGGAVTAARSEAGEVASGTVMKQRPRAYSVEMTSPPSLLPRTHVLSATTSTSEAALDGSVAGGGGELSLLKRLQTEADVLLLGVGTDPDS